VTIRNEVFDTTTLNSIIVVTLSSGGGTQTDITYQTTTVFENVKRAVDTPWPGGWRADVHPKRQAFPTKYFRPKIPGSPLSIQTGPHITDRAVLPRQAEAATTTIVVYTTVVTHVTVSSSSTTTEQVTSVITSTIYQTSTR
jgi:hypothetical protein